LIDILIAHEIKPIAYTKLAINNLIHNPNKQKTLGIVGFLTENLRGTRGFREDLGISPSPLITPFRIGYPP